MNGNGQGNLPEPEALDLESMGYLNGTGLPVHYSNPANLDFKKRFMAYISDVQMHDWGTSDEVRGKNNRRMYSYLKLEHLLRELREFRQDHRINYMCHQGVLPSGHVTCVHVWSCKDTADAVYTDPQVGGIPPMSKDPQDYGKFCTYLNRRSLMMLHGIWPDEDTDGLSSRELETKGVSTAPRNGSTRRAGTRKGNGSKAKASNGAKAPKGPQPKTIDVLIAEDNGSIPGRGDLLRAMKELGVADAAAATAVMRGLCKQQGVAFPPDAEQDPDVFHKLAHAYMEVPA